MVELQDLRVVLIVDTEDSIDDEPSRTSWAGKPAMRLLPTIRFQAMLKLR